jgi:hypothetical protein
MILYPKGRLDVLVKIIGKVGPDKKGLRVTEHLIVP